MNKWWRWTGAGATLGRTVSPGFGPGESRLGGGVRRVDGPARDLYLRRCFGSGPGHSSNRRTKDGDDLLIQAGPYPMRILTSAIPDVTLASVGVRMPIYNMIFDNHPIYQGFLHTSKHASVACDDLRGMAGPFRARHASPMPLILILTCKNQAISRRRPLTMSSSAIGRRSGVAWAGQQAGTERHQRSWSWVCRDRKTGVV